MGTPAAAGPAQCCQAGGVARLCYYVQCAAGKQHQNRTLLSSQRRLTSAASAMQMDMLLFRMSHRQFCTPPPKQGLYAKLARMSPHRRRV